MSSKVEEALRALAEAIREEGGELLEVTVDRRAWHRFATDLTSASHPSRPWPPAVAPEPVREGALVGILTLTSGGTPFRFVGTRK
jgi:hypothetical protein